MKLFRLVSPILMSLLGCGSIAFPIQRSFQLYKNQEDLEKDKNLLMTDSKSFYEKFRKDGHAFMKLAEGMLVQHDGLCSSIKNDSDKASHGQELDIQKLESVGTEYKRLISDFSKKHPLFLIKECDCEVSRIHYKPYRDAFEQQIVAACNKKLRGIFSRKRLEYTSFGSGCLLQDFIIINKVLVQYPKSIITVNCIDAQSSYDILVSVRDTLNLEREIKIENCDYIDLLPSLLPQILAQNRTQYSIDMSDQDFCNNAMIFYISMEALCKQFLGYFKQAFPMATISLCIYKSTQDYLQHVGKKGKPYPDVLCAIDIEDFGSIMRDASLSYEQLNEKILLKNPSCFNLWFAKNEYRSFHDSALSVAVCYSMDRRCNHSRQKSLFRTIVPLPFK